MTKIRGFTGWLFFGLVILALLVFSNEGQAQQDHTCQEGHNCNDNGESLSVETVVGGDSTRLFSVGGSDMEISGCLATFSWLFGVRQFTKVVPDCEALQEAARLDKEGQHLAAAKMRCGTKLYRKRFGNGKACTDVVELTGGPLDVPNLSGLYNQAAQYDERYEQQQEHGEQLEELKRLNEEIAAGYSILLERFERKEQAEAAAARKISQRKKEDREYAQQVIEQIRQIEEPPNDD